MRVTQKTYDFDGEKETIISVNGCSVVYAVFERGFPDFGYRVKSFIADHNGVVVGKGKDWADVRAKARAYAKENFHKHQAYHGLK